MTETVSFNTKLPLAEKERFSEIAEELGMTSASAMRVLIRKFNEYGGFPFEVRTSQAQKQEEAASDGHSDIPPHIYAALMDPDLIKTVKERVENMDKRTYVPAEEVFDRLLAEGVLS